MSHSTLALGPGSHDVKHPSASVYTAAMHSASIPRPVIPGMATLAACLVLVGCGQTGYLYLTYQPTALPPVTRRPAPSPSTVVLPQAACVRIPVPGTIVAPVAAPFPTTSLEQVPYAEPQPRSPEPAPSSLTDVLPACMILPESSAATQTGTPP